MHDNHNHIEDESKKMIKQPLIRDSNTQEETKNENEIEEHHHHQSNSLTPYILLLALGFHGLFEGIALGISSTVKGTLTLLFAIAAHKWAASLTLGISFVKSGTENPQYSIMIGIFALIGPVGMLIGLILSTSTNEIVEGIFLAISTGTFIYIACSEVIVEEFSSQINKYSKFGLFMVGGLLAASLSFLEILQGGHHHDD
jgi:zinc transporter 1/2/3